MSYHLLLRLPGLPKLSANGAHGTWRTKYAHTKRWQRAVMLAVGHDKPEYPLIKAEIIFTRYSSRRPDYDNMVASFKALQDGLVRAGVIFDDNFDVIGIPKYVYAKVPQGEGYVTIEVSGGIATEGSVAHG